MIEQRASELAGGSAMAIEKGAYSTAVGVAIFGLSLNEWAAVAGILAAVIIMPAITFYFKWRHLKLAEKRAKFELKEKELEYEE